VGDFDWEKPDPFFYHVIPYPLSMYGNYYAGILASEFLEEAKSNIRAAEKIGYVLYRNKELRDMIMDENPNLEASLVLYEFKDSW
jgi:hypothetical protein